MKRTILKRTVSCVGILVAAAAACGCGRSSASSGDGGDSPLEREAQDAVMAEIGKHWAKGPEGWTSALAEGSPFAPVRFLRQYKDIRIRGVRSHALDEADKLNGVEFSGSAIFEEVPAREAGEDGIAFQGLAGLSMMRGKGRWTQWASFTPMEIQVTKARGKWRIADDTTLTAGTPPTPEDYARAGVR